MNNSGKFHELTEDKLIQIILNDCDNKEAWNEFYNRMSGYLFATIHHWLRGYYLEDFSIEPDDIFQDVFLSFYQKISEGDFEYLGSFELRRLLRTIARNKVIDSAREIAKSLPEKTQKKKLDFLLLSENIPSDYPSPEEEAVRREGIGRLKGIIFEHSREGILSEKEKMVLKLSLVGLKNPEIAYVLDIQETNVRVIRHRALRKLHRFLSSSDKQSLP